MILNPYWHSVWYWTLTDIQYDTESLLTFCMILNPYWHSVHYWHPRITNKLWQERVFCVHLAVRPHSLLLSTFCASMGVWRPGRGAINLTLSCVEVMIFSRISFGLCSELLTAWSVGLPEVLKWKEKSAERVSSYIAVSVSACVMGMYWLAVLLRADWSIAAMCCCWIIERKFPSNSRGLKCE
jgi:hypothetical protein